MMSTEIATVKEELCKKASKTMMSLCTPVTVANTIVSDPAKAIAAATSNLKGGDHACCSL